ncbi:response regulator [Acetobacter nitrogenifigens DSM 23921 = NBRC 105050]|uniref:DNA-binding response regulator n=1 Tax=Acetobacter nitrogenifigens DSM 23921 = NBRC 105050 TaxID=1120919 RepID=A0A511X7E1_9PROT|nr:response regulator [Acetobacter nitrogenifigens]GBQ95545.1 response regulator [Acetobacter nitrogenifigens DSM 23921 = NBRC 105050]GEN58859.1 DNA-binding response regulator [Acetobacter nitrogenifigens DSM 23921 = NBRC 105050]
MTMRGRVHVVDDDADVRGSLDSLLRSENFEIFLHENSSVFLDAYDPLTPACLLLDIRLEKEDGLEVQERLLAEDILLPVVIMTGHGDVPSAVRSMKQGAVDFLSKPFSDDALLAALDKALSADRERLRAQSSRSALDALYATLTPREKDVAALAVSGLMNKQIAAELGIETITVKVHRGKVMRKMEARSLADLVRMLEALGVRR